VVEVDELLTEGLTPQTFLVTPGP